MRIYGNDFSYNSNKVRFAANAMGIQYQFQSVDLAAGQQRMGLLRADHLGAGQAGGRLGLVLGPRRQTQRHACGDQQAQANSSFAHHGLQLRDSGAGQVQPPAISFGQYRPQRPILKRARKFSAAA